MWKEKAVTDILGVSMHTAWAVPPETPKRLRRTLLPIDWI